MLFVELTITEKALSQWQRLLKSSVTPLTTDRLIASASPTLTAIEREHKLIRYMIMLFYYFWTSLTQNTRLHTHAFTRSLVRMQARTQRERERERERESCILDINGQSTHSIASDRSGGWGREGYKCTPPAHRFCRVSNRGSQDANHTRS